MSSESSIRNRKSIRFRPEKPTLAKAKLFGSGAESETIRGIVRDESYRGCCVIFQKTAELEPDTFGLITVGDLPALKFRVVWAQEVRDEFVKVGLEYLE